MDRDLYDSLKNDEGNSRNIKFWCNMCLENDSELSSKKENDTLSLCKDVEKIANKYDELEKKYEESIKNNQSKRSDRPTDWKNNNSTERKWRTKEITKCRKWKRGQQSKKENKKFGRNTNGNTGWKRKMWKEWRQTEINTNSNKRRKYCPKTEISLWR